MSDRPKYAQAIDAAAPIIGVAIGLSVAINPQSALEPDLDSDDVQVIAALIKGASVELGYLMGAAEPFEILHPARLAIYAFGGKEEDRSALVEQKQVLAAAALIADPTLGGLVHDAEFGAPDPELTSEYELIGGDGIVMPLNFLYTAATLAG